MCCLGEMVAQKSSGDSEEDLAEASRKLEALTGTIAGTKAIADADALKERLANAVKSSA